MAGASNFVMFLLLQFGSFVLAQGRNESHNHINLGVATSEAAAFTARQSDLYNKPSYSGLSGHSGMMMAHIGLMMVAWFFILPLVVVFSIAKSRLALPVNLAFLILNGLGVVVGTVYNITTPDLYEGNAHHSISWIATWITATRVVMGLLLGRAQRRKNRKPATAETAAFLPLPAAESNQERTSQCTREGLGDYHDHPSEFSSAFGSCNNSSTDSLSPNEGPEGDERGDDDEKSELVQSSRSGMLYARLVKKYLFARLPNMSPSFLLRASRILVEVIDRTILILGYVALITGGVTYAGIFRGNNVFNGLAHFIKGGIFFWYGLLTLGRWAGCFADFGWAWNITLAPSRLRFGRLNVPCPSAEFVESFVIFLYGCTNVFLEHLSNWGGAWAPQDLEHVSISVLFFAGGLCGMLAESNKIRAWLNTTARAHSARNDSIITPTKTHKISTNPLPALIIFLLGVMMSSHHQSSMTSTKVHKQWGFMLSGFSVLRILTYTVIYISPPTSIYPTRPPSELLSSFCLISGGIIFMASTKDIVHWMEVNDLMPMFIFTVAMGLSAFVMAWEILVLSLKGWAVQREPDKTAIYGTPCS